MPQNSKRTAAKPSKVIFDPFNSSATGHQRADNSLSGSTAWRDSRSKKLHNQFAADATGGQRMSDTVGAGSLDFGLDGRTANGGWEKGAKGLRTGGQQSLKESLSMAVTGNDPMSTNEEAVRRPEDDDKTSSTRTEIVNPFTPFRYGKGRVRETSWTAHETSPSELLEPLYSFGSSAEDGGSVPATSPITNKDQSSKEGHVDGRDDPSLNHSRSPQIFASLNFYVNGCTAPWSDHQIKRMLSSHGGRVSVALGRRTVTHVILGKPNSNGGSGGALAGSKIQKEITRIGGKGVKFVTADWIIESVKAGKRLPESRFEALRLAPKGVGSVAHMFKAKPG